MNLQYIKNLLTEILNNANTTKENFLNGIDQELKILTSSYNSYKSLHDNYYIISPTQLPLSHLETVEVLKKILDVTEADLSNKEVIDNFITFFKSEKTLQFLCLFKPHLLNYMQKTFFKTLDPMKVENGFNKEEIQLLDKLSIIYPHLITLENHIFPKSLKEFTGKYIKKYLPRIN